MLNMKFSYRLFALAMLVGTLVVVYFTWGDDSLTWNQTINAEHKKKDQLTIEHHKPKEETTRKTTAGKLGYQFTTKIRKMYDTWKRKDVMPESMCEFTNRSEPAVDINVGDILTRIDQKMNASLGYKPKLNAVKKPPLKIILVPHSHNDPGWTKTVDGYFEDQTRHTLDFMVEKLLKYRNMTFIWAESVFLSMWWEELNSERRESVKALVARGQLEIVVGSWVVPDEANPHYFALIEQMIEGHQWLEMNLGVKPQNTWSLDPFGYSSTLPYLYKKAGFQNMVILRTHERVKEVMQKERSLEFLWRQAWDRSARNDIFTLMMPYKLYNIKHTCGPNHDICLQFDFRNIVGEISESQAVPITINNVEQKAKLLLGQYQKKANLFQHNVVLIPLGDDFRFDRNIEWDQQYKNYMMLFNYMNQKSEWNVQARFGTLIDYFKEVDATIDQSGISKEEAFPSLSGDFFPYTDQLSEYWAGYFTTRPYDKNLGREVEHHLRAADILHILAVSNALHSKRPFTQIQQNNQHLQHARTSLGLFQHHDAITGTSRSFVALDYENRLLNALRSTESVIVNAMKYLMGENVAKKFILDLDQPKSLKMITPTKKVIDIPKNEHGVNIMLFNPSAHAREELITVVVNSQNVEVRDERSDVIISQLNPIWSDNTNISPSEFELAFIARFPPLGILAYNIKQSGEEKPRKNYAAYIRLYNASPGTVKNLRFQVRPPIGDSIFLENYHYSAHFSTRNGFLKSLTSKNDNRNMKTVLNMLMYKSQRSGAYIFSPTGPAVASEFETSPVIRVIKGPVYSEVQVIQSLVHHSVRLCNSSSLLGKALEINNIVDIRDMDDKELIMRVTTDMKPFNNTFYTDMNGFHIMKRQRFKNFPIEASYYPMTSMMYIEDSSTRLSILSTQPLGASSQEEGEMEVMLDRRLRFDDNRGLGEGINDNKRTPSRFLLLLEATKADSSETPLNAGTVSYPTLTAHTLVNNLRHYPLVAISVTTNNDTSLQFEPMLQSLPCDLHLVHFRSLTSPGNQLNTAFILHRVGYGCLYKDANLPCKIGDGTVSLHELFKYSTIGSIHDSSLSLMYEGSPIQKGLIKIPPMEINTYKITFK